MEYNEFLHEVTNNIKDKMGEETQVVIHQVIKNNGVVLDGLVIMEKDRHFSPTIYLNAFYYRFLEGEDFDQIIGTIMDIYNNNRNNISVPTDFFLDFASLKDKVAYKLINYDKNKELLNKIPHRKWKDLAMVYYVVCDDIDKDRAVVMIYNNHMENWAVDEEILYDLARVNTPKLYEPVLRPMNEIVSDIIINEKTLMADSLDSEEILARLDQMNDEFPMYVLTNHLKHCGAGCIMYDGLLKNFADFIQDDLYIIPSSIHEVILIPKKQNVEKQSLIEMVMCVNREELSEEEILADNVYEFNRECGFIQ